MPLSMGIISFLSYYDGLGKLQKSYVKWLQDRKEDIRRQLLLGQLQANLMDLEEFQEAVRSMNYDCGCNPYYAKASGTRFFS